MSPYVFKTIRIKLFQNLKMLEKFHNVVDSSEDYTILGSVSDQLYRVCQVICSIYALLCVVWLVYVVHNLITQIHNRRRLVTLTYYDTVNDYKNRLFMQNEIIFRNSIFLLFLCFELIYNILLNIYGILDLLYKFPYIGVPIGPNCTLYTWTYLGNNYDGRFGMVFINILNIFRYYSFSMMIWLFGATLFHLSFAARNELQVKKVVRFISTGLVVNFLIVITTYIPFVSLFGLLIQSLIDQINLFIVIYIAKRKFFPAMNSRVIDAFHLNNAGIYLKQKILLNRYKVLVCFLIFTFELYILKNIFLFNMYAILQSISVNQCWFNVTFHLPVFTLPGHVKHILDQISSYLLVTERIIGLIVYLSLILVNLTLIFFASVNYLKRRFQDRKIDYYRYQAFSAPLLTDNS